MASSVPSWCESRAITGHRDGVRCVAFSPDDLTLASGGADRTARIWRARDGSLERMLDGPEAPVLSIGYSPDGRLIAGACGHEVLLWSAHDGRLVGRLRGHTETVTSIAFSPSGAKLASSSGNGEIVFWNTSNHERLMAINSLTPSVRRARLSLSWAASSHLHDQPPSVSSIAFSPDEPLLASGVMTGEIQIWRVSDGQLAGSLRGHTSRVLAVAFHPKGRTLASGAGDHTIRLWDVTSGKVVQSLAGHTGTVMNLSYSRDGAMLASASQDGTFRLWAVSSGEPMQVLESKAQMAECVAMNSTMALAGGDSSGAIRIWESRN